MAWEHRDRDMEVGTGRKEQEKREKLCMMGRPVTPAPGKQKTVEFKVILTVSQG